MGYIEKPKDQLLEQVYFARRKNFNDQPALLSQGKLSILAPFEDKQNVVMGTFTVVQVIEDYFFNPQKVQQIDRHSGTTQATFESLGFDFRFIWQFTPNGFPILKEKW